MKEIRFNCPACQQPIATDLATAMNDIACPGCAHIFNPRSLPDPVTIPAAPAPTSNNCPTCANQVSLNAVSCPKCGHIFKQAGGVNLKDPVHVAGLIVCLIILGLAVTWIYIKTIG